MNQANNDLDTQPWYKQGWPWALIAIPFLTVVAGVITFIIANNTSDSLVQDDYYKKGLAINSNIERVEKAIELGLKATISIDFQSNLLTVNLESNTPLPTNISLNFSHPTLKNNDQSFQLTRLAGTEFVTDFKSLENANWHVSLEDEDKSWLIKTRWLYPDKSSLVIDTQAP